MDFVTEFIFQRKNIPWQMAIMVAGWLPSDPPPLMMNMFVGGVCVCVGGGYVYGGDVCVCGWCMCVCRGMYVYVCERVYMYVCAYVCIYLCGGACVCVRVYSMLVSVCVYTYQTTTQTKAIHYVTLPNKGRSTQCASALFLLSRFICNIELMLL